MKDCLSEETLSAVFEAAFFTRGQVGSHGSLFELGKEVPCQQGRPDFIASPEKLTKIPKRVRIPLRLGLSQMSSAKVVALLNHRSPRSKANLGIRSGLSPSVLQKSLRVLENLKLIHRDQDGLYRLTKGFPKAENELWAFEVKLFNWKRALFQLLQYAAFAHRVVIVIPELYAYRMQKHIDRFKRFGVGVISVEVDSGTVRVLAKPRKRRPASKAHYLFAIGKLLN
jgi:DNA-binding transcriptional ArsR family regulator